MNEGGRRQQVRTFVGLLGLLAALLFGGMAAGLAVAVSVAGGSVGAIMVGFVALPLCLGLGLSAWRGIAFAWLGGGLLRALLRARGDEARFRQEAPDMARGLAAGAAPGTWVFVPIATVVSGAAALAIAVLAARDGTVAGVLLFGVGVGYGFLLRRLARRGLLPLPEE